MFKEQANLRLTRAIAEENNNENANTRICQGSHPHDRLVLPLAPAVCLRAACQPISISDTTRLAASFPLAVGTLSQAT